MSTVSLILDHEPRQTLWFRNMGSLAAAEAAEAGAAAAAAAAEAAAASATGLGAGGGPEASPAQAAKGMLAGWRGLDWRL